MGALPPPGSGITVIRSDYNEPSFKMGNEFCSKFLRCATDCKIWNKALLMSQICTCFWMFISLNRYLVKLLVAKNSKTFWPPWELHEKCQNVFTYKVISLISFQSMYLEILPCAACLAVYFQYNQDWQLRVLLENYLRTFLGIEMQFSNGVWLLN